MSVPFSAAIGNAFFQILTHSFMTHLPAKSTPLRIGAVNYLNTKPLVYGLAGELPGHELSFELPSQLADRLAAGELDVALAPCVELSKHPEWSIISSACIGCLGPVLSVQLLFRCPPNEVRTLALDEGSRTSVILAQLLLQEHCGVCPELLPLSIDAAPEDVVADAILVIGDRAINLSSDQLVERWDLGQRWRDLTGLPFVFALWVARPGIDTSEVERALNTARDRGSRHLPAIAAEHARELGLSEQLVLSYLRDNLNFQFGAPEQRALAEFFRRARHLQLIDHAPEFTFDTEFTPL
ncbi:menaquinone biosynthetic enzyme MqnA/MqnD family protein [Adhaeretor mobilis]|uniref:Chorismate dehydratase n=1 Tax=Adhaeretor mobilis TaxID=1930276 RepID=A0A517MXH6_9BACT|nr:menaquinone biosynthesis protein [Adhaeretor mobilis]QDS99517.1 Chorismate dehydratase [Adhaeretor mobilis]